MLNNSRTKSQEPRLYGMARAKSQHLFATTILILASCLFSLSAHAQCAMCRAALEGEGNAKKAAAVNDGIVYLMMIPYLLVAVVGVFIFRLYRNKKT